ncbi:MAG TPA: histidine phosphatase family protein, partial [Candidatus Paceibacterota bacterium]|nr:histidine phosphatase family protein [Candidatus Paceibacterota bacterium]
MADILPPALASFTLPLPHILLFLGLAWGGLLYLTLRMEPKRFYIVRHGRTVLNEQGVKQGSEGKLSPAGRDQAEKVGAYLSHFPIRIIHTSPYERAIETATIIGTHLRARIRKTPLLAERRSPSEVIGKSVTDSAVL